MDQIKRSLKKLRLIQSCLIGFALISAGSAERLSARMESQWSWQHWVTAAFAAFCMLEGFNFRYHFLPRAAAALARDYNNSKALKQWELWQLMSLVMAWTVAAYGVILRGVLRGGFWQALVFYLVGLFLLLLWTPRTPTAPAS
jgi:hypothetical protein